MSQEESVDLRVIGGALVLGACIFIAVGLSGRRLEARAAEILAAGGVLVRGRTSDVACGAEALVSQRPQGDRQCTATVTFSLPDGTSYDSRVAVSDGIGGGQGDG